MSYRAVASLALNDMGVLQVSAPLALVVPRKLGVAVVRFIGEP